MHSRLSYASLFILLLGQLLACQSPSSNTADPEITPLLANPDSTTITDDLGRDVLIPRSLSRIIPIAPSITELLFTAGAGDQVVAVSHADDYPESIKDLPRFNSFPMDYEALVRLEPDLIIGTDQINNPRDAHLFESLNIPIVYYTFETWNDISRTVRILGTITSNQGVAAHAADSLDLLVENIRQQIPDNERRPRVLLLIGSDQLFAFGRDNYVHELIEIAGGISLTESMDSPSPTLSEEYVITADPDVIVGTFSNTADLLQNHPAFQSLSAVRNQRICLVDPSLILRPGPRLVEGMRALASCIHPVHANTGDIAGIRP